jgi:hypothetical protein
MDGRRRNFVAPTFVDVEYECVFRHGTDPDTEKVKMKKILMALALATAFIAGVEVSGQSNAKAFETINAIHEHVLSTINEMERARAENHYDTGGHAAKAEEHLRAAERDLKIAADALSGH